MPGLCAKEKDKISSNMKLFPLAPELTSIGLPVFRVHYLTATVLVSFLFKAGDDFHPYKWFSFFIPFAFLTYFILWVS